MVINGGFENLNSCNTPLLMNQATNWCDYSGYSSLFNYCVPTSTLTSGGIPYSWDKMFQYPHTGNGFGGVSVHSTNPLISRGYIQTVLSQTLQASKKYVVKFYVNVNNDSQFAIDKICALLTNTPIACNTGSFTPYIINPQIVNKNGIITDTLNWIEVCDTMTAVGNDFKYTRAIAVILLPAKPPEPSLM